MNHKKQILEGSRAIALTVKNINPAVISAYPITPQTHIVEDSAKFKADGRANYEYVRAESEFAAASIILGASATGARVYSATSSQGLLLMTEVVFNIAGMRLPVVMTCANRAVSSPINIWCDHGDVMTMRDAGWLQFFAENHQEAVDQHVLAYKLAEKLNLPVMINIDGFILSHSYETVIIPEIKLIKKYLPNYQPRLGTYLNPQKPVTMGAFFTPQHYQETRQQLQDDLVNSLDLIKKEYQLFNKIFQRTANDNGLVEYYGAKKPKIILVAMGSMAGTIKEVVDEHRNVGLLKIKIYRPFPVEDVNKILAKAKYVAVLEKAVSLGQSGPLYGDIKMATNKNLSIKNYIVGLGGRDVTKKIIHEIIEDVRKDNKKIKFLGNI